jgi:polysaccharide deacetylase family protein (PEP-CTERM system associated)
MINQDISPMLTINLEDYFQVAAFRGIIRSSQWYRFETRLEHQLDTTLSMLSKHDAKATFFVLGWIAERFPDLIRRIVKEGHEIASRGYLHRPLIEMSKLEFAEDAKRSKELIEEAAEQKVLGYRLSDGWFQPSELWALEALHECGYLYDSSIAPRGRKFANRVEYRNYQLLQDEPKPFHEFPIGSLSMFGYSMPVTGGNYLRQMPGWLATKAVRRVMKQPGPKVWYFHTWELDPDQPKVSAGSRITRMRHYRNIDRMNEVWSNYLEQYKFTSIANHLCADTSIDVGMTRLRSFARERKFQIEIGNDAVNPDRIPVSVVIPCFNEEQTLPYLANTLRSVRAELGSIYDIKWILVDDRSTDSTWNLMQSIFGKDAHFCLHRHENNLGVAGAICTGIDLAQTEIVCSMDADCTYDPHELANMIPRLIDGVDLVTASPYHRDGHVLNVPKWRLTLSRGASWLYRRILNHKLATYTSCFRVYRHSAFTKLKLQRTGYLGVAEMLTQLDQRGGKIVEHPATLEVRALGNSKMKTMRTIIGHLELMVDLLRNPVQPTPVQHLKPTCIQEPLLQLQD